MGMTRRQMLGVSLGGLSAGLGAKAVSAVSFHPQGSRLTQPWHTGSAEEPRKRLGIASYSYHLRLAAERGRGQTGLADPITFVEHCHKLGAGGVQTALGTRDTAYLAKLKETVASAGMFLEGQVRLPKDRSDVDRLDAEVRTAKEAGVTVLRTVMLGGRRYETFETMEAFRKWADQAFQSLLLAEPVMRRHGLRLAVENHKDYRAADLVALLKRIDSTHVGICIDTGNNIALLEDPLEVIETLVPLAFCVHLKDMAVAEYEDGFLLAEVPFGKGFLDLKRMIALVRKTRPEAQFSLEMITRDPLKVPCLTPKYWATFPDLPGRDLARTLALVRKHRSVQPLPSVSGLGQEQQLAAEEENIRSCLAYAKEHLDL